MHWIDRLWCNPIRLWGILLFLVVGCTSTPQNPSPATDVPTQTTAPPTVLLEPAVSTEPESPTDEPVIEPTATFVPTPIPDTPTVPAPPTDTVPPPPTLVSDDLAILPEQVYIYPVPTLYAGDVATFQFTAQVPPGIDPFQVEVVITIDGNLITTGNLNGRNLGGDAIGRFAFAWDTSNRAGKHGIQISIDPNDRITVGDENPENNIYVTEFSVLEDKYRPVKDDQAQWVTRQSQYANIHVVTGTAAARDLNQLIAMTDQSIGKAISIVGETPNRVYDLYFIDRVIGQGGYASGSMVVSYLDRNYAGGRIEEVITHETIHLLDQQITRHGRLVFLAEGLAVWGAGGHYKPEDLTARAAALVTSGNYIPLVGLINNFYPVQHEIGYLEAGAFVKYLVDTYGWETFKNFYAQLNPNLEPSYAASLDRSMVAHYGKSLELMEQEWLAHLATVPTEREVLADLNATIKYYNLIRRYQLEYDPTAHFLLAWLPNPNDLMARGLTAELTRHPEEEINLIIETMLTEADKALQEKNYQQVDVLLNSVERIINNQGIIVDPLAAIYQNIVFQSGEQGYEVQRLLINGTEAVALATSPYTADLQSLRFVQDTSGWQYVK